MKARSVTQHVSALRRIRNTFIHLRMTIRSGCNDLSDILKIPLMLALFAAYVCMALPLELFWASFVEHSVLWGFLLVTVTSLPIIYGVLKRMEHESQYASIPKEGWEGIPLDKLPEAVEDYKKFIDTQKHDTD